MTLLELLVVVAILAVLATVAIQSTTSIGDQVRYETTQKALQAFRDATLGNSLQVMPDGSRAVSGFVADMGRLPRSRLLSDLEMGDLRVLSELYSEALPANLKAYALYPPTAANTTLASGSITNTDLLYAFTPRVPAGWRGPYLRKPSSEKSLVDGWGKLLASRSGNPAEWPAMLLAFKTNASQFTFADDAAYAAVEDSGREVCGVFAMSGFEGAPTGSDAFSGRFYSTIVPNEYRRSPIAITLSAPGFSPAVGSTFTVLMYGPNPEVEADGKPIRVFGITQTNTTTTLSLQPFVFDVPTLNSIGTKVFVAKYKTNAAATVLSGRPAYVSIYSGVPPLTITYP